MVEPKKMIPNLVIDEEVLTAYGKLKLHAIVYHYGTETNNGHYTASVKMNETWFEVDDTRISKKNIQFNYTPTDQCCPYLLIYKNSDVLTSMTPTNIVLLYQMRAVDLHLQLLNRFL